MVMWNWIHHNDRISEFKTADAMRLGIDARALTPEQDSRARELAERIGRQLATKLIEEAANEREAREAMLLTPRFHVRDSRSDRGGEGGGRHGPGADASNAERNQNKSRRAPHAAGSRQSISARCRRHRRQAVGSIFCPLPAARCLRYPLIPAIAARPVFLAAAC
jgi:hypothetical protein